MIDRPNDAQSDVLFKDEILDRVAHEANVAQFVSFGPGAELSVRFCHIRGCNDFDAKDALSAVAALLNASPEGRVNVRSYRPEQPKGGEFVYGVSELQLVVEHLTRLSAAGFFTIVNETIDVMDGGVSGVVVGDLIEFAPQDTPRCVEKPGTCRFPRPIGIDVLARVYGFLPDLDFSPELRVEFSIHPLRRGVRHGHTIIWEIEDVGPMESTPTVSWPNRFSQLLGDKAFGLLVADSFALPVPNTTVVMRDIAPFTFGKSTGTAEPWIRTCPVVQDPGKFTTQRGWLDPFRLLQDEDPALPHRIASILAQEGVEAVFSGALAVTEQRELLIEGVSGIGSDFMLGKRAPEILPKSVLDAVMVLFQRASEQLGPIRIEWVFDGRQAWVVQLHKGSVRSTLDTIVPGHASEFQEFDVTLGLDALRDRITELQGTEVGILLVGDIGITSHFGDLLRRSGIPSKLAKREPKRKE